MLTVSMIVTSYAQTIFLAKGPEVDGRRSVQNGVVHVREGPAFPVSSSM